jgi:DNA-binding transcriptional MerR regulator
MWSNREVARICEVTPRRVLHWSEKGIIIPRQEAIRPGMARGYSYYNLLEVALCRELFTMGFGIYSIKKMMGEWRELGDIKKWADAWVEYFAKIDEAARQGYEREIKGLSKSQISNLEKKGVIVQGRRVDDGRPIGVLFYFFDLGRGEWKTIVPHDVDTSIKQFKNAILNCDRLLMINLGKLKERIDERIGS